MGQLAGPFAWVMGNKALKEIDANPGQYDGRTEVLIGKILGIVGTVIMILTVISLILFFGFFFLVAASSPEIFNEIESTTYSAELGASFR